MTKPQSNYQIAYSAVKLPQPATPIIIIVLFLELGENQP